MALEPKTKQPTLAALTATQTNINRVDVEVQETQHQIKVVNEALNDELVNYDNHRLVMDLRKRLKAAEKALALDVKGDGSITRLMEEKAQLRGKLKGSKSILSQYLVQYKLETKNAQVPDASNPGYGKAVRLEGKLSKRAFRLQEQMNFGEGE